MTEREKMLAGELYRPSDPELVALRKRAKGLCARYNAAPVDHDRAALEDLLGYATSAYIEPPFFCDYGFNIRLGERFYANHGLVILDVMRVEIGAGSVGAKDVPPRWVAAGNPCRVVKELN